MGDVIGPSVGPSVGTAALSSKLVFWLALEGKLSIHLKHGGIQPFDPSGWADISSALGMALDKKVILTSYVWFTISKSVGFESFNFSSTNSWKFAGEKSLA